MLNLSGGDDCDTSVPSNLCKHESLSLMSKVKERNTNQSYSTSHVANFSGRISPLTSDATHTFVFPCDSHQVLVNLCDVVQDEFRSCWIKNGFSLPLVKNKMLQTKQTNLRENFFKISIFQLISKTVKLCIRIVAEVNIE